MILGGEILFDRKALGCSLPCAEPRGDDFASKIESTVSARIPFALDLYRDQVSGFLLDTVELGEQLLICDLGVLMLFKLPRKALLTEKVLPPF